MKVTKLVTKSRKKVTKSNTITQNLDTLTLDLDTQLKELKNDFSIDDFVTNNFWATEACRNFIVMAYR